MTTVINYALRMAHSFVCSYKDEQVGSSLDSTHHNSGSVCTEPSFLLILPPLTSVRPDDPYGVGPNYPYGLPRNSGSHHTESTHPIILPPLPSVGPNDPYGVGPNDPYRFGMNNRRSTHQSNTGGLGFVGSRGYARGSEEIVPSLSTPGDSQDPYRIDLEDPCKKRIDTQEQMSSAFQIGGTEVNPF